ncbi:MAG: formylglycine-generating enzyme family protein [Treponema sp.]|nr:formylglycine-generating enzyme family protein [Treponema sp.]
MKKVLRKGMLCALVLAGLSLVFVSCGSGHKKNKDDDEETYTPAAGGGGGGSGGSTSSTGSSSSTPALETKWITVPAGTFTMGRFTANEHTERITTPFVICDHEVTQGEYKAVMGSLPPAVTVFGDNLPVTYVSWYDAIRYCNELSKKEGRTPAYLIEGFVVTRTYSANGYRLPTEEEWEYAAGDRGATVYSGTSDEYYLGQYAWYDWNSGYRVQNVKSKKANGLGLYDMSGNAWEWCWDEYENSETRIVRGGSCNFYSSGCAVSYRFFHLSEQRAIDLGFRVIRMGS